MTGHEVRRIRGNMPQEKFAVVMGCSGREVSRWEKRGRKEVNMHNHFKERMELMHVKKRRSK